MPHKKSSEAPTMPEIHMDFAFLGEEGDPGNTLPVLVVKERSTRMGMSAATPRKTTGTYIARRVMAFLKEVGCEVGDVTAKSDQEPAIKSIVEDVGKLRAAAGGWRYVVENSPVGSSASNGVVERHVQTIQQQSRVLKSALESRWGVKIPTLHAVVPWLVEYAGLLVNRFEVGRDGKTRFERCKGKKAKTLGIEFGEAVLWKRKPGGGALGKLTCMWEDGVYLGIRGTSGEIIIGDKKGVWKTRTVQRKPVQDTWAKDSADMIVGVPWRTSEADSNADGEQLEVIKLSDEHVASEREVMKEPVPRRFRIDKEDLIDHGYTAKCPGCRAALTGARPQGHSEPCRA